MTATAHALIGSSIAAAIGNPEIGLPLAFVSHPLADMIPHWDFGWGWRKKTKTKLFLQGVFDLSLGVGLSYFIFGSMVDPVYLFTAILVSESWDLVQAPYWLLDWHFPPFSTLYKFGHETQGRAKLPWGIITQAATVVGVIFMLRFVH